MMEKSWWLLYQILAWIAFFVGPSLAIGVFLVFAIITAFWTFCATKPDPFGP